MSRATAWEAAYCSFGTSEQEVGKFTRRLREMGVEPWPRDLSVVELFCGRGNGLVALEGLGFRNLTGVDLSSELISRYRGSATTLVANCRELPLKSESVDAIVIQGGLHHLVNIDEDLGKVLSECYRVLRSRGRLLIVEPWRTPFLDLVHLSCRVTPLRRAWRKLDALATMIEQETPVYQQWLAQPARVHAEIERLFHTEWQSIGWGKARWLCRKAAPLVSCHLP